MSITSEAVDRLVEHQRRLDAERADDDPRRPILPPHAVENIRARRLYDSGWTIGYLTKGGTYIIASNGSTTDSGQPRDLLAILPGDVGQGAVLILWVAVGPQLVDEVVAALS